MHVVILERGFLVQQQIVCQGLDGLGHLFARPLDAEAFIEAYY